MSCITAAHPYDGEVHAGKGLVLPSTQPSPAGPSHTSNELLWLAAVQHPPALLVPLQTRATRMNDNSSRSHAIVRLYIESRPLSSGGAGALTQHRMSMVVPPLCACQAHISLRQLATGCITMTCPKVLLSCVKLRNFARCTAEFCAACMLMLLQMQAAHRTCNRSRQHQQQSRGHLLQSPQPPSTLLT